MRRTPGADSAKHTVAEAVRAVTDLLALYAPIQLATRRGRVLDNSSVFPSIKFRVNDSFRKGDALAIPEYTSGSAASQRLMRNKSSAPLSVALGVQASAENSPAIDVASGGAPASGSRRTTGNSADVMAGSDSISGSAGVEFVAGAILNDAQNSTEFDVRQVVSFGDLGLESHRADTPTFV